MIELRPNVSGTYKGFIYCNSMVEAEKILKEINPVLKKFIQYKASIKRGCSEFYKLFPNFKLTDNNENNFMIYENKWNKIEEEVDKKNNLNPKRFHSTISGFSLSDLLIMYHWFNYAKFINDLSFKELEIDFPHSEFIFQQISTQINFRKNELMC